MQLDDVLRRDTGRLMQVVDVLGDDAPCLARAVEARKRVVPTSRLRPAELVFHGEAPAPGFVAHLPARSKGVERDRLQLGPDAAGRAEIRDAAFGRNSGAGERQHDVGRIDEAAQAFDGGWKIGRDHGGTRLRRPP